jgi:hypothetical protein
MGGIEIDKYRVIKTGSVSQLNTLVNDLVKLGYKPIGSHKVVVKFSQNKFAGSQHMATQNELEYSQTLLLEE